MSGPPVAVFAARGRAWVCDALLDSLVWRRKHAGHSADGVLNACRGWRFVAIWEWSSKSEGPAWALQQDGTLGTVWDAERARQGETNLNQEEC